MNIANEPNPALAKQQLTADEAIKLAQLRLGFSAHTITALAQLIEHAADKNDRAKIYSLCADLRECCVELRQGSKDLLTTGAVK